MLVHFHFGFLHFILQCHSTTCFVQLLSLLIYTPCSSIRFQSVDLHTTAIVFDRQLAEQSLFCCKISSLETKYSVPTLDFSLILNYPKHQLKMVTGGGCDFVFLGTKQCNLTMYV